MVGHLSRSPRAFLFSDDGKTPNNPDLPLLFYRKAVDFPRHLDPAAVLEQIFAYHGWKGTWRNGIHDFLHFHTRTHEVLAVARGQTRVQFGGAKGKTMTLTAGDVVVLPAGTGHRRVAPGADLLVVGAYPPEGDYDQPQPDEVDHAAAARCIAKVAVPKSDPVCADGPLCALWQKRVRHR
jgi:uncharacterized protein YjlB